MFSSAILRFDVHETELVKHMSLFSGTFACLEATFDISFILRLMCLFLLKHQYISWHVLHHMNVASVTGFHYVAHI